MLIESRIGKQESGICYRLRYYGCHAQKLPDIFSPDDPGGTPHCRLHRGDHCEGVVEWFNKSDIRRGTGCPFPRFDFVHSPTCEIFSQMSWRRLLR
jgi:hypothetical protein